MKEKKDIFALRRSMFTDLYDSGKYTFEDIGLVYGITKERVRQLYWKTKHKDKASSIYGEMDDLYAEKMGFKRNHKER